MPPVIGWRRVIDAMPVRQPLIDWILHSLRSRLMLLMLVAALPAFAILLYATFWLRGNAIAQSEAHILNQAHVLAVQHQERVEEGRALLQAVAGMAGVETSLGCTVLLGSVQRAAPSYVRNLLVVRPDGRIACAARGSPVAVNLADRPYFQRALLADGFLGADYLVGRLTGEPVVVFSHTVRRQAAVAMVLVLALDISWLHHHPQFAELPPGAAYTLYDRDGTLLLRHPGSLSETGRVLAGSPFWQALSALRGPATFRATDADGIEQMFGYAPLGPAAAPYGRLTVSVPAKGAFAEADRLLQFGLIGLAIACGLGLLVGWAGGWALVLRPAQPIFTTVRRVAGGDLTARTGIRLGQGNEIGRLANEVDRMAASLAAESQERRQAEAALRREGERAQAYLDVVGVMVIALDAQGNITLANRKACEVLGCAQQGSCLGGNWFDRHVPPAGRDTLRDVFRQLMAGTIAPLEYYENEVQTLSGERRLVAWHNALLSDGDGAIVGTLSAGEDITERRQAEEQLRATRQMLALVTDTIPYHVFWKDCQSTYIGCNAAFARGAGLADSGEIVGKTDDDLVWHAQADLYRQDDAEVMRSGQPRLNYSEPQSAADGSILWLETSKLPLRGATGEVIGVLGLYRDITARKQLQEERERLQLQLQQAQKMEALGQLTGGIAHDFNNILASVLGFSKLALQRHVPDPASPLADYLREVISAGERARDLVAKMLTFSRARPDDAAASLSPVPLVREALRMLASTIPASIRIDSHFASDIPDVAMLPVDLHQILMNLVINARDALPGKGRIDVRLAPQHCVKAVCAACHTEFSGDYVALSVADNGHGIPAEVLPRIFDPFFTTKEVGKGTGMGLAVVHGLTCRSGGHFQVESQPAQGTRFEVLLPLAARPAEPPQAPAPAVPPPGDWPGRGQVMVIDDEAAIRRLLSIALAAGGWSVRAFADADVALAEFRRRPDAWRAVITDEAMPELTGAELIVAMHALRPALPIILCTGYSDHLEEAAAKALGACEFFRKPVDTDALLATLAQLVTEPAGAG